LKTSVQREYLEMENQKANNNWIKCMTWIEDASVKW
jgi:hypothetical protein